MISKRVMLVGALVVGVAYVLALERVSAPASDSHLTSSGELDTSERSARELLSAQPAVAADGRVGHQVAELSSEMAQLKTELSALRDEAQRKRAPIETAPTPEQEQAMHDEYMAGVESAFERELRDDRWATGTTQLLRQALETEPIMLAALRGIECRSSSCRMEIRDDGSTSFAEEFPLMVHQMGAVLSEVRFEQSDLGNGAQLHVLYMSKSAPAADEP